MVNRNTMTRPDFFRFCSWLQSQDQPIKSTQEDIRHKASSELDLGYTMAITAVRDALDATGIILQSARKKSTSSVTSRLVIDICSAIAQLANESGLHSKQIESCKVFVRMHTENGTDG
jgi:cytochrome b561